MIKEVYESVRKFVKTLENEKEKYVHNPKIDFTRLRKIVNDKPPTFFT